MEIFEGAWGGHLRKAVVFVVALLGVFLLIQSVAAFQGLRYIGAGVQPTNTINVSGHGELYASPDIATFTYSVVSNKSTVADAQTEATTKSNAITAYLKSVGVAEKDIQTSGYSIYPQYEYQNAVCPTVAPSSGNSSAVYCPPGRQVLKGYEARQTTTIKIRDLTKAGDLLGGVGSKGATELSGINFTFDDPNAPQDQARQKAIADAKAKADVLAKQLGVTLVRVVSFNESSYPGPMYYAKDVAYGMGAGAAPTAQSAPEISPGQNKVSSDVNVTYEIK